MIQKYKSILLFGDLHICKHTFTASERHIKDIVVNNFKSQATGSTNTLADPSVWGLNLMCLKSTGNSQLKEKLCCIWVHPPDPRQLIKARLKQIWHLIRFAFKSLEFCCSGVHNKPIKSKLSLNVTFLEGICIPPVYMHACIYANAGKAYYLVGKKNTTNMIWEFCA